MQKPSMLPYNFDAWIPGLIAFILVFKALITLPQSAFQSAFFFRNKESKPSSRELNEGCSMSILPTDRGDYG